MTIVFPSGRRVQIVRSKPAPAQPGYREIRDPAGNVVDYKDVKIRGYLSTFGNTDRTGEIVLPGAFAASIPVFMTNPVLMVEHGRDAWGIAGRFTMLREDERGLYSEATLSNSPASWVRDMRLKVVRGELGGLSFRGVSHFRGDGRAIFRVELAEGSLTARPCNPSARILEVF